MLNDNTQPGQPLRRRGAPRHGVQAAALGGARNGGGWGGPPPGLEMQLAQIDAELEQLERDRAAIRWNGRVVLVRSTIIFLLIEALLLNSFVEADLLDATSGKYLLGALLSLHIVLATFFFPI